MAPEDQEHSDLSLDDGRYIRLPLKVMYSVLIVWGGFVWGYLDLRSELKDAQRETSSIGITVNQDHQTLMDMHDNILKLGEFADESKRMYNRYFRDFNDPDRKN